MLLIPFEISPGIFDLFVALNKSNLERMRSYDPANFEISKLGSPWNQKTLNTVIIGFVSKHDEEKVTAWLKSGRAGDALLYLTKGFAFREDLGERGGGRQAEACL